MNAKNTIVISAFPACGKTWFFNNNTADVIIDSDSSDFSWMVDADGNKIRNPDFPNNYMAHIKENIGKADIIFVSSHLSVRQALTNEGIKYVCVYPEANLKEEWIGRCYCRGNDENFLKFINESWDKFMSDIETEPHGEKLFRLNAGQHLSNILANIKEFMNQQAFIKSLSDIIAQLELNDEEIENIIEASKNQEVVTAFGYRISKTNSENPKYHISANVSLGPVKDFYNKPNCEFIVDDYEIGYMIWIGSHRNSIQTFSEPFRKSFAKTSNKILKGLTEKEPKDDIYASFSITYNQLWLNLSIRVE